MFSSFERTLFEGARKTLRADLSQSLEVGSKGQGGGGNGWFTRRVRPKIIRTDIQAIVAAENAIPHLRGKLIGDSLPAAAKFDGQVRDTEPGIDDIGFNDGAGWTSLNAKGTTSAQVCGRFILFEIQSRQNLSEQEP